MRIRILSSGLFSAFRWNLYRVNEQKISLSLVISMLGHYVLIIGKCLFLFLFNPHSFFLFLIIQCILSIFLITKCLIFERHIIFTWLTMFKNDKSSVNVNSTSIRNTVVFFISWHVSFSILQLLFNIKLVPSFFSKKAQYRIIQQTFSWHFPLHLRKCYYKILKYLLFRKLKHPLFFQRNKLRIFFWGSYNYKTGF